MYVVYSNCFFQYIFVDFLFTYNKNLLSKKKYLHNLTFINNQGSRWHIPTHVREAGEHTILNNLTFNRVNRMIFILRK